MTGRHKGKLPLKTGDTVTWHTGSYAMEPHNNYQSWFPEDKVGEIIKISPEGKYLLEFKDGSRSWASPSKVELVQM